MIKFKGSRTAYIQCSKCKRESPKFRVYLYHDGEAENLWNASNIPTGWFIEEEAELYEDVMIFGVCPECQGREFEGNQMTEDEIYAACLEKWGLEAQLGMLQEECAELIVAVNKVRRHAPKERENLTEELADVQNMINQIKVLCPDFERVRLEKLERVKKLLREANK